MLSIHTPHMHPSAAVSGTIMYYFAKSLNKNCIRVPTLPATFKQFYFHHKLCLILERLILHHHPRPEKALVWRCTVGSLLEIYDAAKYA